MKQKLTLLLAGLALSSASSFGATIDMANLGGSFPTYTDPSGIPNLVISYTVGDPVGTTEDRGWSNDGTRGGGMSLPMTPMSPLEDGHLSLGPGDTVTFDFTNVNLPANNEIYVAFFDLDNNAFGGNEGATVTHDGGSIYEPGAPSQILNDEAHFEANIFNVGPLVPDGNNLITVVADDALTQGSAGNGFFAVQVSTEVIIPEPSSALLGLLGFGFFFARRRR